MDLVFHNYTDVLMFIRERRDRTSNQLQTALNPPLGSGPKPTKAQRGSRYEVMAIEISSAGTIDASTP